MENFITRLENMALKADQELAKAESWLIAHMPMIEVDIHAIVNRVAHGINRIGRAFMRLMAIGLILCVVASLCPGFEEKYPVLFGWYTGFLELGEFAVRSALKFIYSLFTGDVVDFWQTYQGEASDLEEGFLEWLRNI